MKSRLRTIWRQARRRLCSLLVLVGVCASILPIPLSTPKQTDKDLSRPFPCQNRPCGCRTAEQCWKKCCCFSNSQKLAWAKAHRVVAPDYVHTAAVQESKSATCQKNCCSKKSNADSGCHSLSNKRKCHSTQATVQQSDTTRGTDYVIGVFAEQCRGQSSFWNSLPWAVMPQPVAFTLCSDVATIHDNALCVLPSVSYQPPAPPPRRSRNVFFAV